MNTIHSQRWPWMQRVLARHEVTSVAFLVAVLLVFLGFVGFIFAFFGLWFEGGSFSTAFTQVLGGDLGLAVLGAAAALLGYLYTKIDERRTAAVTTALSLVSDIGAILRVMTQAGIAEQFILLAAYPNRHYLWADAARKEDYFAIFHGHVDKLGILQSPKLAADITRFYVFLKASRDATSPLVEVKKVDPDLHRIRMIAISVCDILRTTYDAGIEAIGVYEELYPCGQGSSQVSCLINDKKMASTTLADLKSLHCFVEANRCLLNRETEEQFAEEFRQRPFVKKLAGHFMSAGQER